MLLKVKVILRPLLKVPEILSPVNIFKNVGHLRVWKEESTK